MTLVTTGDEAIIEQITKQLNKLIDVVKLVDLSEGKHIERELMMIKVRADQAMREELKRLADIFRANIIDVTDASYTIEMTGDGAKMDAFINTLDPELIIETVRSGPLGIGRGGKRLTL
jgi:acetolactate synthase-1/3 small subunit